MERKTSKHVRLIGVLPFLFLPLAACGASSDARNDQKSDSNLEPSAPLTSASATPSPTSSSIESRTATAVRAPVAPAASQSNPAPAEAKTPVREGSHAAPVPAPAPTGTPVNDPHAGHDMSTMSDEDMKAMGHN